MLQSECRSDVATRMSPRWALQNFAPTTLLGLTICRPDGALRRMI
ncbi:MAG TPA: hypothetical protein PKC82_01895 [Chitinophagaceae bacterium]|nr:hypothetical protein [Chitinophagaceae bacterium]